MLLNNSVKLMQRHHGGIVAASLHLLAAVVFLCFFSLSAAFGQSTYSDSWVDESTGNILGSGVIDGSYTHNYYVDTTLRSSNGRYEYGTNGGGSGYARTDASLLWDWNDLGEYITESQHWARCPFDELYYYSIGTTNAALEVGASIVVFANTQMRDSSNRYIYNVIVPCNVICTGRGQINDQRQSNYIMYKSPWYRFTGGHICVAFLFPDEATTSYSNVRQECYQAPS